MSGERQELQFKLHLLGWRAFQDLCATILREVLGQTFQVFAPGNDGGRDGAFRGTWTRIGHESFEGSCTVQCKHTSQPDSRLTIADLEQDIYKASELVTRGLADSYLLMTNHTLTGEREAEIRQALKGVGVRHAGCFGAEWIAQTILESQRLRMLVPRVYGLGDLSQILDERAYAQADQLFHSATDELARFVPTAAYRHSAEALANQRFVCLLGEPGSGKSTIAAALALHAADAWGTRSIRVPHPSEFKGRWNPKDSGQLFWVDDALGALQYQRDVAQLWNQLFPELNAAILGGTRVIWTSRDYIFQRALPELKINAFPLLATSRVVINVGELSTEEKQEMLYNHMKMGDQPKKFRAAAKPHLSFISRSKHLLPEIVRRLALSRFTKKLVPTRDELVRFVEYPAEYLSEVIDGLTDDERAALAVLFSRGGRSDVEGEFTQDERALLDGMGGTPPGVQRAFRALEGTLLSLDRTQGRPTWVFRHPTMRDAVAELLIRDPALVRRYIERTPIRQIMREVTCGEVGLQNVRVILHRDLYDLVAAKVEAALKSSGRFDLYGKTEARQEALSFLSYRCDAEFLKLFRARVPNLVHELRFWSYLDAVPEVGVVAALYEHGLLTEDERKEYVTAATDLAVQTPDPGLLTIQGVRAMFTDEELVAAMNSVRERVVARIDDIVSDFGSDYSSDTAPDSHFSPLKEACSAFRDWFAKHGDAASASTFSRALNRIDDLIAELDEEYRPPASRVDHPNLPPSASQLFEARSRFDDIDE